jgi:hypothetical protein
MVTLALFCALAPGAITFDVLPREGLVVSVAGIPIVQGSGFQVYAPGWTKSYYGSAWGDAKIDHVDSNTIKVSFSNPSGASGELTYHLEGNTLHIDQAYSWNSDDQAEVEVTGAYLWSKPFERGTLDSGAGTKPFGPPPAAAVSMTDRRLAPDSSNLTFADSWGSMSAKPSGGNWLLFDGRDYPAAYAMGRSIFWYGVLDLPLAKGKTSRVACDLTFNTSVGDGGAPVQVTARTQPLADAERPVDDKLPILPHPKRAVMTGDRLEIGGAYKFPAGQFFHFDEFTRALANRFEMPSPKGKPTLIVDGGIHDLKLGHPAFQIDVRGDGFTVFGQDEQQLSLAVKRLALLAYSENGHVYLPEGVITDWPTTKWRGFHLFAWPGCAPYQKELLDRVLTPLGYNEGVIECENSAWATLPKLRGDNVMPLDQLRSLFKMYRQEGVDPIPLVQSFGHAEYLFRGGDNLDIAFNTNEPYGVDPRKPGSKPLLDRLWDEVFQVTEATTVHFGCDEVDMEGWKADPALMTQLWGMQMPTLGAIAARHNAQMIIWGDMALAPYEAPDATNGGTPQDAAARRAAIPAGAMIADWHYKGDPNVEAYFNVIQTWKQSGHDVIASTWHDPLNIAGFTAAGAEEAYGTLQTNWSGHGSADSMVSAFDDYAAYVLNAEYAWSGRQDKPSDLGYDYRDIYRRLMYAPPMPLSDKPGASLSSGPEGQEFTIERYSFAPFTPVAMFSALEPSLSNAPKSVTVSGGLKASTLVIACRCRNGVKTGAPVVNVVVHLVGGTTLERVLRYGEDLLSANDKGIAPLAESEFGLNGRRFAALVKLPVKSQVSSVDFTEMDSVAGFELDGITGVN